MAVKHAEKRYTYKGFISGFGRRRLYRRYLCIKPSGEGRITTSQGDRPESISRSRQIYYESDYRLPLNI